MTGPAAQLDPATAAAVTRSHPGSAPSAPAVDLPAQPGPAAEIALTVDDPLDGEGAERLRFLLDDAITPGRSVVLDMSAVQHVSAPALAVLVGGHRRLRDGGGALVVARPSEAVVRVLRISGLHRVLLTSD